jgi:hypothetical protein
VFVFVCVCVCVCIIKHVCVLVCACIHVFIHTHTSTHTTLRLSAHRPVLPRITVPCLNVYGTDSGITLFSLLDIFIEKKF